MATHDRPSKWARYANAALGAWLVLSAFVWMHVAAQQTNAWIVGVLAVAVALLATTRDKLRYVNAALAVWLFASIWALPDALALTAWNNALVAIAMFAMAMVPNHGTRTRTVGDRTTRGATLRGDTMRSTSMRSSHTTHPQPAHSIL